MPLATLLIVKPLAELADESPLGRARSAQAPVLARRRSAVGQIVAVRRVQEVDAERGGLHPERTRPAADRRAARFASESSDSCRPASSGVCGAVARLAVPSETAGGSTPAHGGDQGAHPDCTAQRSEKSPKYQSLEQQRAKAYARCGAGANEIVQMSRRPSSRS